MQEELSISYVPKLGRGKCLGLMYWCGMIVRSSLECINNVIEQKFHNLITNNNMMDAWPCEAEDTSVLSRDGMTTDEVRIGNRIYWTLWYSECLHFTVHRYTHVPAHVHYQKSMVSHYDVCQFAFLLSTVHDTFYGSIYATTTYFRIFMF
jgi:hypothetical protein